MQWGMPIEIKSHETGKTEVRVRTIRLTARGKENCICAYWYKYLGDAEAEFTGYLNISSPYLSRTNSPPMPGMWKLNTKHLVGPRGLLMHPWWLQLDGVITGSKSCFNSVVPTVYIRMSSVQITLNINRFFFWVLFFIFYASFEAIRPKILDFQDLVPCLASNHRLISVWDW